MINYTKNVWADNDASKPVSAARLTTMENGIFDAHWKDAVRVYQSANVTIANATWTTLIFNTERYDQGNLWSVGNAERLVAANSGVHHVGAAVGFASNVTGYRAMRFLHVSGGVTTTVHHVFQNPASGVATFMQANIDWYMTAGSYMAVQVFQSGGGNLGLDPFTPGSKEFWMRHVVAL